MNIAVVGTGYVGLVSGTCLAETGNHVICVDIDQTKVELMQGGEVPIYEPNLDKLFLRNIEAGRLEFTTDLKAAVDHADIIFLALPTPPDEDGSADLSYVLGVANQLGTMMTSYKVVVDKSTVPVGTADKVRRPFPPTPPWSLTWWRTPSSFGKASPWTTSSSPTALWWGALVNAPKN